MTKAVGIGFKEVGKIYWFNAKNFKIKEGDQVVVETIRGLELGKVVIGIQEINDEKFDHELKDVIRVATAKDLREYQENEIKGAEALVKARDIIKKYKLDMKTLGCEYTLDGSKLLIYYNAEGRVDFRELVKALASEFKVRIELRQIGQREGVKLIGAMGICGREVCCKKHLREFDLVTMKMAKDQGMALSASKIAGICGKLMCCIGYESPIYEEAKRRMPGVGDIVSTPTCKECKVINVDYLKEIVKTEHDEVIEVWPADKTKKLRSTKKKETIEIPDEIKQLLEEK